VTHIFEDRLGNLWVGTLGGGLNRRDRGTGSFSHFLNNPNNHPSLGVDSLSRIREDHSSMMWTASPLSSLDPKTGSTTRYVFRSKEPGGEILPNVRAIQEDRDGVRYRKNRGCRTRTGTLSDSLTEAPRAVPRHRSSLVKLP
jgi:hypothetical protein